MVTRSKTGNVKAKVWLTTAQDIEPNSVKDALASSNWTLTMKEEYDALLRNGTWNLVNKPIDRNIIRGKWVFKIKKKADGSIERYKARLTAKGYNQILGFDFNETFSPVFKPAIVRLVLSLALSK